VTDRIEHRNKQIAELLKDFRRGSINRRELIARGTALGISAFFLGRLTTDRAFAQDATPEAITPGSTITMPADLRTDLAGAEITAILAQDGPGVPWEEAALAMFTEVTGIAVNRISGSQNANERLTAQYLPVLNAQAGDIDAMQIDVIWPGILAPHAIDLTEAAAGVIANHFPALVENNTVDGKLVGIPFYTDAGMLYYRTDLFEKYGIAEPPATWADLETSAKTIMDGERGEGMADMWGFVFQGNAYEGLTCNALEWQVSNGGGTIIERDGTVSVNNPNAAAAINRAAAWVGTIAPEGVTTYQEEEARGVWQGGNAAMMRNWPYAFSAGQSADSPIKDLFEATVLPMGDGEGARNAATLGGWQMMASQYSANADAAIELCKFMTSTEIQKSRAIELSNTPTINSLYEDAEVLEAQPVFGRLLETFTGGAVARPSTVSSSEYNNVSTAYFTAVHGVMTGGSDAESALADLEGTLADIMSELE
jgi:trehalose/maltose transport system substrate-binding protein